MSVPIRNITCTVILGVSCICIHSWTLTTPWWWSGPWWPPRASRSTWTPSWTRTPSSWPASSWGRRLRARTTCCICQSRQQVRLRHFFTWGVPIYVTIYYFCDHLGGRLFSFLWPSIWQINFLWPSKWQTLFLWPSMWDLFLWPSMWQTFKFLWPSIFGDLFIIVSI